MSNAQTQRQAEKYAGADWLAEHLRLRKLPPPSVFGRRVADLLGQVVQGLYHIETEVSRADWTQEHYVELNADSGWLADVGTYDCSRMTLLVVGCHDACIRLDVSASKRPWKLGYPEEELQELRELLGETVVRNSPEQGALLAEVTRLLRDADEAPRATASKIRQLLRPLTAAQRDKSLASSMFKIMNRNDEYAGARDVFDAVQECGYDPDDLVGQPCLRYVFTPRDPTRPGLMTGHPTMEQAVASARWLLTPVMPSIRRPDDARQTP